MKKIKTVHLIILVNVLVFLLTRITGTNGFILQPYGSGKFEFYQLFTSMFGHLNAFHLFANMFILYSFGGGLELITSRRTLLMVYLVSGFVSSAIAAIFSPVIGSSGAVCGIIGALFYWRPWVYVKVFFIYNVRLRSFAYFLAIVSLVLGLAGLINQWFWFGISHFAYLAGLYFGGLYCSFMNQVLKK